MIFDGSTFSYQDSALIILCARVSKNTLVPIDSNYIYQPKFGYTPGIDIINFRQFFIVHRFKVLIRRYSNATEYYAIKKYVNLFNHCIIKLKHNRVHESEIKLLNSFIFLKTVAENFPFLRLVIYRYSNSKTYVLTKPLEK